MRLFTAIELTEEAREAIATEQQRITAALKRSSFRPVRSEHLHLTLTFIGEVSEERASGIVKAMAGDIPLKPFRIVFAGIGAFPPRGAPRALYVGVVDGADETVELQRHLAGRLEAVGVELERRPFHPHVTLGRWRESRPSDRPNARSSAPVVAIEVSAVTLFQSRISSSGPTYTRLATARLACP